MVNFINHIIINYIVSDLIYCSRIDGSTPGTSKISQGGKLIVVITNFV